MVQSLKQVLMERDGLSEEEAEESIRECQEDLYERLEDGECPDDILQEYYGLEPDYLMDLI